MSKPLPHQISGVLHIEKHKRTLLADVMGLGKTAQVLAVLRRNPEWLPSIVVCPSAVKYHWEDEAFRHFGLRASVCDGRKPPDLSSIDKTPDIRIINYDILSSKATLEKDSWVRRLKDSRPASILLDECHYLTGEDSRRSQDCEQLCDGVEHLVGISGTPAGKCPAEMFQILRILWPREFPSFPAFASRYCAPRLTTYGFDYSGSANLDELRDRLLGLGMLRRSKAVLNLPPKKQRVVICPVDGKAREEYEFAKGDFLNYIRTYHPDKYEKIAKAKDLVKVGYLLRICARMKIDACVRWLQQRTKTEKVVSFCCHTWMIKQISKRVGVKHVIVDGQVTGRRRHAAVQQFQNDPETKLFLGNLKAAGTGIHLTAAHVVQFCEFWWNPVAHNQAGDRVHRIGQMFPVEINYMVARGTIEQRICRLLTQRQAVADQIVGDVFDQQDDFNLYESLLTEQTGAGGTAFV